MYASLVAGAGSAAALAPDDMAMNTYCEQRLQIPSLILVSMRWSFDIVGVQVLVEHLCTTVRVAHDEAPHRTGGGQRDCFCSGLCVRSGARSADDSRVPTYLRLQTSR